jgi:hypothetical protein
MLFSWIATATFGVVAAVAQSFSQPHAPTLTYLYTLTALLDPSIEIGEGAYGQRVAIPIIGGTFKGPRLNGKLSQYVPHLILH